MDVRIEAENAMDLERRTGDPALEGSTLPSFPGVEEDAASVSYLGVRLRKRSDGECVPGMERFAEHVITDFDAKLMQKLAIAFELAPPVLIEAGSAIGKTSSVERMCAQLGWNCFYANCSKYDPETLIGADRTDESTRSGFGWRDGIVMKAIRHGGVLVLDEYNFMSSQTRGRLHEILDAVLNGKEYVTLTENGGEKVPVHPNLRIVAFQNSPDQYLERQELDRANFTRYVYIKEAEELPEDVLVARTLGAIGQPVESKLSAEDYLVSNETFDRKGLERVEGLKELMLQFREFHRTVEGLVSAGQLARDAGQPVYFAYPRDLQRMLAFMERFYDGNPVHTLHKGIEYFYVNKFSEPADRQQVRELAAGITLARFDDPKRRSIDPEPSVSATVKAAVVPAQAAAQASVAASVSPLDYFKRLRASGVELKVALVALSGDDSPEAWAVRTEAIRLGAPPGDILRSVSGIASKQAQDLRLRYLETPGNESHVLESLAGLVPPPEGHTLLSLMSKVAAPGRCNDDFFNGLARASVGLIGRTDPDAEACRAMIQSPTLLCRRVLRTVFNPIEPRMWVAEDGAPSAIGTVLFPLRIPVTFLGVRAKLADIALRTYAGSESDAAWEAREHGRRRGAAEAVYRSLAGLTSDRSWTMRQQLRDTIGTTGLASSVVCVSDPISYELRDKDAVEPYYADPFARKAESYALLDSPLATQARDNLWRSASSKASLAGMNRNPFAIAVKAAIDETAGRA